MVSHGESWRDTCAARGVTDLAIGSSDWLGRFFINLDHPSGIHKFDKNELSDGEQLQGDTHLHSSKRIHASAIQKTSVYGAERNPTFHRNGNIHRIPGHPLNKKDKPSEV